MRPIIRIDNLGKQYRIGARPAAYRTLRESLTEAARAPWRWLRGRRAQAERTIWALKDVSLEVRPGEVVGIIGRNGAGKSTLLKILARITEPTTGHVDLYGRVGSLLEVGTGFHAELTGRDNIYLSGAILGMRRREIERQFGAIVAFGEMDEFLDTPVKHYSSGMYMRLAFAVAAHLDPEILVVDEVLAVGDVEFQKKCLGKMGDVARRGRTVLFVSHQMSAVKALCSRAVLLNAGAVARDGDTNEVVGAYLQGGFEPSLPERVWNNAADQPGNALFRLHALRVLDASGQFRGTYLSSAPMVVELEFDLTGIDRQLCVGFALLNRQGVTVLQSRHTDGPERSWPVLQAGRNRLRCTIPAGLLNYGKHYVAPKVHLHALEWVIEGHPEVAFEVQLDHGLSPYWATIEPHHFPGVIAPCLQWHGGPNA